MTRKETAIISAYTGILIGKFSDFHQYAEHIMRRPIYTHEFASDALLSELRERSREDFCSIEVKEG